jgi:hypothetical protein
LGALLEKPCTGGRQEFGMPPVYLSAEYEKIMRSAGPGKIVQTIARRASGIWTNLSASSQVRSTTCPILMCRSLTTHGGPPSSQARGTVGSSVEAAGFPPP